MAFHRPTENTKEMLGAVFKALGVGKDIEESVEDLEVEYTRLFVGPDRVLCPPYESVYREDVSELERGLLMGPSTVEVAKWYNSMGLRLKEDFKDLPDHIAVELEFMHYLCREELRALDEGDAGRAKRLRENQKRFFEKHLYMWVPMFVSRIFENTDSEFYKLAALLLKQFIEEEKEYFS